MNPRLDRVSQNENKLTLSFTNTNYSIINALRRTIISDIPVVSFTTFPHEDNKCEIFKNTSGLNNELVKHMKHLRSFLRRKMIQTKLSSQQLVIFKFMTPIRINPCLPPIEMKFSHPMKLLNISSILFV